MSLRSSRTLVTSAIALMLTASSSYAAPAAHISVSNQKEIGSKVTIADAALPSNGFLAIHASDASGNMVDNALGYVALKAGDHKAVKVNLPTGQKSGEKLWAVLHQDNGAKGKFEFGAAGTGNVDTPFMVGGKPVEMPFTLR